MSHKLIFGLSSQIVRRSTLNVSKLNNPSYNFPRYLSNNSKDVKKHTSKSDNDSKTLNTQDKKTFVEKMLNIINPPSVPLADLEPEKPATAFEGQQPQKDLKDPMRGILVYALDEKAYWKYLMGFATPVGTFIASLGALSMTSWDAIGTAIWVGAATMSAINTYYHKDQITRMTVITNGLKDTIEYPRHKWSLNTKMITELHIERIGLPLAPRIKEKIDIGVMERVEDQSYLKNSVFPGDVKEASNSPLFQRIVLDKGKKRIVLFIDQIRQTDYINQILTYSISSKK